MAKLTRRGLLKGTSIGVATAGVIAGGAFALPKLVQNVDASSKFPLTDDVSTSTTALPDTMVVYVRDSAKGEIGMLVGEREIISTDPVLVSRLTQAVSQ
ncbi:MAG: twin-arginine translocation signal domain-containing protein [Ktedonobacteraceae bacterium]|nr:twin-arginine translocation signal domain-containing protein [Ktedonobacteraceae bacterium]